MPAPPRINVARVRELLAKGCTQDQVVRRLGCSKSAVSRIAKGTYREARR